jgi:DNA-binding transcriptional MerR regulator
VSEDLGYFAKYISEQLKVTGPTLRRWSQTLESAGHEFKRNTNNQRIYYNADVEILKTLQTLVTNGIQVETAAKYAITGNAQTDHAVVERSNSDIDNKLDQLLEHIQRQDERLDQQERFNRELLAKLEEQHRYITESIERRDQQLMTSIREVQETKRLMAAAEEEKQKEEPKGFFARLFGK